MLNLALTTLLETTNAIAFRNQKRFQAIALYLHEVNHRDTAS
ncbi:MAG: hypothetical protein SFY66_15155 [Oculatellaceae cyanobacterium bins.114]|nr:hypothetical protein [Oculatellaceae cyanobacterium bins.114]